MTQKVTLFIVFLVGGIDLSHIFWCLILRIRRIREYLVQLIEKVGADCNASGAGRVLEDVLQ